MKKENLFSHIDRQIGQRLYNRRRELNILLKELADFVDISYQQIQKYENGANRIPASILLVFSKRLNVEIEYFYKDINFSNDNNIEENKIVSKSKEALKILIIEDNSSDEALLKEAIKDSNINCLLHTEHDAKGAKDFLYQYKKFPKQLFTSPDIILLDLNLPKIKGNTLLKDLKKDQKFKKTPVIILTNSVNKDEMQECYNNGANAFLTKSFDINEFFQDIKKLLQYWSNTAILPS
jgi:two-component system response regulator